MIHVGLQAAAVHPTVLPLMIADMTLEAMRKHLYVTTLLKYKHV
jgi:hypothetical protein